MYKVGVRRNLICFLYLIRLYRSVPYDIFCSMFTSLLEPIIHFASTSRVCDFLLDSTMASWIQYIFINQTGVPYVNNDSLSKLKKEDFGNSSA